MNFLISIIVVCVVIFLVIIFLPIILTGVMILAIVACIFVWFLKRRIRRQMGNMQTFHSEDDDASYTYNFHATSSNNEDIIDVEFVEREDVDK